MRTLFFWSTCAVLSLCTNTLFADDLIELSKELKNVKSNYENRIKALEQRIATLEKKKSEQQNAHTGHSSPPENKAGAHKHKMEATKPVPHDHGHDHAHSAETPKSAHSERFKLGLIALFSAGGSSVKDAELAKLQAGGHDPNRNGFTVQNVELSLRGAISPNLKGQANIVFLIDQEGETVVELEEAFLATHALPYGVQIKAGQYFTEFGRHNPLHPHLWDFVDQPVVLSRFFGGDGLRSQGARFAWRAPVSWSSEFFIGAQNAGGETLTSFLWQPNKELGTYTLIDRGGARSMEDLLWSGRWLNGGKLSPTLSANFGVSALLGPNASGTNTNTRIRGVDLYLKWHPEANTQGFPFVAWQTEWLARDYETPGATLKDTGAYTQLLWGFRPRWVAGLRAEYADGNANGVTDSLRDRRERYSANLSFYSTAHSKLRLQYNHDRAEHLLGQDADSIWLQYEFNLGAHAPH